jgi:hypothetical protein
MGCLGLMFAGSAAVLVVAGVKDLGSQYRGGGAIWLIFAGLAFLLAPWIVLARSRRKWVAILDANGVTTRGGAVFRWNELLIVAEVHTRYGRVNHVELVFRGGRARVFPLFVANAGEVAPVLVALRAGKNLFLSS